jgi:hypothetical protein
MRFSPAGMIGVCSLVDQAYLGLGLLFHQRHSPGLVVITGDHAIEI